MSAAESNPEGWLVDFVDSYLDQVTTCLRRSLAPDAQHFIDAVVDAIEADRATIRLMGNGGSSAIARTLDWATHQILSPSLRGTRCQSGWDLHALVDLAGEGDLGSAAVRLLERDAAGSSDVVILISGSGNSSNLVAVAEHCAAHAIPVLALTGRTGGELGRRGVPGIRMDSEDQQIVEDCAHAAGIALLYGVRAALSGTNPGGAIRHAVTEIRSALEVDVHWIDHVSDVIAEAAARGGEVTVLAPEGGGVALSVEHLTHNLTWDLSHYVPVSRLRAHSGFTLADYTGTFNDSGLPGLASAHVLGAPEADDATIVFGTRGDHPATAFVREAAAARGRPFYGWYGSVSSVHDGETVAVRPCSPVLAPLVAQVVGHILLRVARAKLHDVGEGRVGGEPEAARLASLSIAPLADLALRCGEPDAAVATTRNDHR